MEHAPSRSRRYLALWLPLLSTDRLARIAAQAGHAPDDQPMVLVTKKANALRIVASDREGYRKGLVPGLAFADAKARVPNMRVVEHDEAADANLLEAIAEWCDRYSPIVAVQRPGMVMLDITGVPHLFGGERELARDIGIRIRAQGFARRIAIASTARAARALCRFGRGGIVPAGQEREWVAPLPIDALECGEKTLLALRRAGLTKIGDLAARPLKPLAARFGAELTDDLVQLLGEIDRPLVPRRPMPLFMAEQRFADPIGLMEDISAALDTLVARLCAGLDRHGQGGRSFEVAFYRADGKIERVSLLSGQPLKEPKTLKRLLEMRMEALADPLDPGFGFDMIRLYALAGDPLAPAQAGLDGKAEAQKDVAELVDRLSARFGAGAVQRFIAQDTHLPERASRAVPGISDAAGAENWSVPEAEGVPTRPLFLFYPAHEIDVVAQVPDGPPRRFRWRGVLYDVAKAEGPERIAPEWWRTTSDTRTRDYFRVEDSLGKRFWVFRYGLYGREAGPVVWYLQGLFP